MWTSSSSSSCWSCMTPRTLVRGSSSRPSYIVSTASSWVYDRTSGNTSTMSSSGIINRKFGDQNIWQFADKRSLVGINLAIVAKRVPFACFWQYQTKLHNSPNINLRQIFLLHSIIYMFEHYTYICTITVTFNSNKHTCIYYICVPSGVLIVV